MISKTVFTASILVSLADTLDVSVAESTEINTIALVVFASPISIVNFSIKRLKADREKRRKKLWKNTMAFHKGLKNIGLETKSASQIVPVIIGDEKKAVSFGKFLLTKKIFAQPIRFPTVKKNSARIRISITAWHTLKEIDYALEILEKAGRKFQII